MLLLTYITILFMSHAMPSSGISEEHRLPFDVIASEESKEEIYFKNVEDCYESEYVQKEDEQITFGH